MALNSPIKSPLKSRITGAAMMAAAVAMAATPAQAAELPQAPATGSSFALINSVSSGTGVPGADVNEWRRRCGFFGCRRGFRRGWRGRRGIRAGEVLAGVAIIGGIAAIASAANNNRRRDRDVVIVERDRNIDRRDDRRFDNRANPRATVRSGSGSGIDNAVSQCLTEIERDVRVDSVDGASRVRQGWVVSGSLFNGSGFTCAIGNDGRISGIDYGGFGGGSSQGGFRGSSATGGAADGQWSDDRYADARASANDQQSIQRFASAQDLDDDQGEPLVPLTSDRLPAYPGGPLPGEEQGQ
ncbi:MAG: hypothetical protein WBA51_06275 [Erythrobacter sp.]